LIRIGTAGWSIPRQVADQFPAEGSSLERYAARFDAAEINSSFHRPHRISTWERWRDSVPDAFRFSAKLPKEITHQRKLVDCSDLIGQFLSQAHTLGEKLAVLLVQLPPKLELDETSARAFFEELKARTPAGLACEPRNVSWFTGAADLLLEELGVARVAADPAVCPEAAVPGGWRGLNYWRLHGSPVVYRSSYADRIPEIASRLLHAPVGTPTWCIFDNTASSAGAGDALELITAVLSGSGGA
jgi:uncharacterized protein YecE (DUF72 family)